jgi:hypothetical protein
LVVSHYFHIKGVAPSGVRRAHDGKLRHTGAARNTLSRIVFRMVDNLYSP